MFTGIIEDIGKLVSFTSGRITVETMLNDIAEGDSLAVNGVCLTVTRLACKDPIIELCFDVAPESVRRTTLERLSRGDRVNLERAMKAAARFGGHFLSGHVEGTVAIEGKKKEGNAVIFRFALPESLRPYITPKGSVGIDGISLTVAAAAGNNFTVSIIPHTLKNTTLMSKLKGDRVNIEPDILAKYTENIIDARGTRKGITPAFLKENGF